MLQGIGMSGTHEISVSNQQAMAGSTQVSGPTLAWALRRAALGLMILMVTVTTAACLLYAGIEPDRADASQQAVQQMPSGSDSGVTGSIPADRR